MNPPQILPILVLTMTRVGPLLSHFEWKSSLFQPSLDALYKRVTRICSEKSGRNPSTTLAWSLNRIIGESPKYIILSEFTNDIPIV